MTYEVYRYIFIGAAVLCGIMLVISIILFFALKIPKIISDLSGATARKAIKAIREQNEASGDKGYKVSALNMERGKITDKISSSGKVLSRNEGQMRGIDTTKINTMNPNSNNANEQTTVLGTETTVLSAGNETSVLSELDQTTVLSDSSYAETSVLYENAYNETTVLDQNTSNNTTVLNQNVSGEYFVIEYDITFVHSNECI